MGEAMGPVLNGLIVWERSPKTSAWHEARLSFNDNSLSFHDGVKIRARPKSPLPSAIRLPERIHCCC
jgi:hypothetical protein